MRVGQGSNTYQWNEDWAKLPDTESVHKGWAHHGVVVTESGDVITFHPGDSTILVLDGNGNVRRTWELPVADAHGITLVKEGDAEYLWIADNGRKRQFQIGYEYPPGTAPFSGHCRLPHRVPGRRPRRLHQVRQAHRRVHQGHTQSLIAPGGAIDGRVSPSRLGADKDFKRNGEGSKSLPP